MVINPSQIGYVLCFDTDCQVLSRVEVMPQRQYLQEVKASVATDGAENIEAESGGASKVMTSERREGHMMREIVTYFKIAHLAFYSANSKSIEASLIYAIFMVS